MQIQFKIIYYIFLSYLPTATFASYSLPIVNDGECSIAIFSVNQTDEVFECIIEPSQFCNIELDTEIKLIAVDPYSIEQPRFKTELFLDTPPTNWCVNSSFCQEPMLCVISCPLSYSPLLSNELSGPLLTDTMFRANGYLHSNQMINSGLVVRYSARQSVDLGTSFEVDNDTTFEIDLTGCDTGKLNNDKTDDLQYLGNIPFNQGLQGKDKNIWDLQEFEDRIFIGYGNTTTNPGPIQLFAWDNTLDSMIDYGIIRGEAIEKFRVIQDTLFIPNSDPRAGDKRKYNYLKNGQLVDISIDYNLAHVRDMIYFNNNYYLLGNTRCPDEFTSDCSGLLELTGNSHQTDLLLAELEEADPYINVRWNWFFGAWEYQDKLIIPNATFNEIHYPEYIIKDAQFFTISDGEIQWSANQAETEKLKHFHFYPADTMAGTLSDTIKFYTILRPFTSIESNDKLLYTLRSYSINQNYDNLYLAEYNNSRGMYIKDSLMSVAKPVIFPEPNAIGEDILLIDNKIIALANREMQNGMFQVFVYMTESLSASTGCWQELFHFQTTNLVRSFEYHNDTFYFGLGMNEGDEESGVGELYKLNWSWSN